MTWYGMIYVAVRKQHWYLTDLYSSDFRLLYCTLTQTEQSPCGQNRSLTASSSYVLKILVYQLNLDVLLKTILIIKIKTACSCIFQWTQVEYSRIIYKVLFVLFFLQNVVSGLATHTVTRLVPYQSVSTPQDTPMEVTSPHLSCDQTHQDITYNLVSRLFPIQDGGFSKERPSWKQSSSLVQFHASFVAWSRMKSAFLSPLPSPPLPCPLSPLSLSLKAFFSRFEIYLLPLLFF